MVSRVLIPYEHGFQSSWFHFVFPFFRMNKCISETAISSQMFDIWFLLVENLIGSLPVYPSHRGVVIDVTCSDLGVTPEIPRKSRGYPHGPGFVKYGVVESFCTSILLWSISGR